MAPRRGDAGSLDLDGVATTPSGHSAVALFWLILVGLVGAIFGVVGIYAVVQASPNRAADDASNAMMVTGLGVVMGLPLVQLASILATLLVLGFSRRPDRGFQMKQVGRIFVGSFLGCLAGILAMFGIGMLLSIR